MICFPLSNWNVKRNKFFPRPHSLSLYEKEHLRQSTKLLLLVKSWLVLKWLLFLWNIEFFFSTPFACCIASLALWKTLLSSRTKRTLQSGAWFSSETSVFIRPLALPVWQDVRSFQRNLKGALKRRRKWVQTPAAWSRSGRHNGSYIKHAEICRNYCCHRSYPSCLRLHTAPRAPVPRWTI